MLAKVPAGDRGHVRKPVSSHTGRSQKPANGLRLVRGGQVQTFKARMCHF
jgi:hypothetical protein